MSSDELPDDATHAPTALDPDSGSGPPRRIGPYRVLEEIGEGGMGVVYLAQQSRPIRRRVALKVIKVGMIPVTVSGPHMLPFPPSIRSVITRSKVPGSQTSTQTPKRIGWAVAQGHDE